MEATTSPVAVNAGAVNPGNLSANNSPALAADPTDPGRIAILNRVDRQATPPIDSGRWERGARE